MQLLATIDTNCFSLMIRPKKTGVTNEIKTGHETVECDGSHCDIIAEAATPVEKIEMESVLTPKRSKG